jgi:hypothetical protein
MIRVGIIEIALIATPFLLFWLYRAVVGRKKAEADGVINETPYQILFLTGSAVALASLVTVVLLGRDDERGQAARDRVYVPARVVDGEVVPGYFVTREEAIARGLIEPDEAGGSADEPAAPDARAP